MNQNVAWPVQNDNRGIRASRAGQWRVIAAGLVVLVALAYLVWASLPQGTVYYQTVKEVLGRPSDLQPVRVAGVVAEGSVQRSAAESRLRFEVVEDGARLPVVYSGVIPDIFGPNIQVVVEGRRDAAGVFQAQTLLAKCPSRFDSAVPTPGGVK